MTAMQPGDSRRLMGLALIVTLKMLVFFLLGRTETMNFIYAGF